MGFMSAFLAVQLTTLSHCKSANVVIFTKMFSCIGHYFIEPIISNTPISTRFRVTVQVEDGTGATTVVMFNAVTERLLDVSAKKLLNKMPPGDNSVPAELQPLLGKELVFKLKLNKYNLVDGLQDYGVSTVYTPVGELESTHAKNVLATVSKILLPAYLYFCKKILSTFTCSLLSFFRLVLIWWTLLLLMTMFRELTSSERGNYHLSLKMPLEVVVEALS